MNLWDLADLCTPWCVHTVVTLRVAEQIQSGVTGVAGIAEACGADRDSLHRVLRHLAAKGLFVETAPGEFALNDAARELLAEPVHLGFGLDGIGGRMAHAWGTMLSAVRTGRPAYHEVFGRGFWDDLEANPAIAASFDALIGPGGHGPPDPEVLVNPEDWQAVRTVADVGGGTGSLLAAILRQRPQVRGTLIDLPRTVARSGAIFEAAGVADRVTVVGQSFFDPLPSGCDLYLLKNVIGDWPDREATAILRRCAEAARPAGRVVVLGVGGEQAAEPELLMMVLVGGRGRSSGEFRAMAAEAGLQVTATGRQPTGKAIVECRPA